MIAKTGRTLPWLVGLLGLLSASRDAFAQGNTFNPYGNSGYADYREFGNPMYSNNPALPGQSVLNAEPFISRPRANSYQQFVDELDGNGSSSGPSGRSGPSNLPYYRAYQSLNPQFNRVYRPGNTEADRKFREKLNQGDAAFAAAMTEKDPAKRAKLLRQVEQDFRLQSSKGSPSRAAGPRASSPAVDAATPPPATRAPVSGTRTAPVERRAPSPYPSSRRPSPEGAAARAPSITRAGATDPGTARSRGVNRPAPDPSTIPVPPPR